MNKPLSFRFLTIVLLALAANAAWAGDNIQMTVSIPDTYTNTNTNMEMENPEPAIKVNGNETTHGTIQLFYVVEAYTFPVGEFATFEIEMTDTHLNGANNAVYEPPGAPLTLRQTGSSELILTPDSDYFPVTAPDPNWWTDTTLVTIRIPEGVSNEDGAEVVGNLNFDIPGSFKIGTPTSVQVHIMLSYPDGCLDVFNFMTDTELDQVYHSMDVNVNTKKGWVSSTNPSQVSDNVLIANNCPWDESFDLAISLDPRFDTNPNGNPGNAIHTYDAAGIVDEGSFDIEAFGSGIGEGQNLCLEDVSVPAGSSFLAAVHSAIIHHLSDSLVDPSMSPFAFGAELMLTSVGPGCSGGLHPSMYPNTMVLEIPFTVND